MEENMGFGCSGDCSGCGEAEKKEPEAEVTEEPKEEVGEESEVKEEVPVEEAPAEEPAVEAAEEPAAEEPKEEGTCSCSEETTKSAEDLVRDLVNFVSVCKEEEKMDVTTKIDPATADELAAKLEELAKKVGEICSCG